MDFDSLVDDSQAQPQPLAAPAKSPLMFDDLKADNSPLMFDDLKDDVAPEKAQADINKYETTGQRALTAIEGASEGMAGPLATLAERGLHKLGVPGLSNEEIAGRRSVNPGVFAASQAAGVVGGMLTGTGEAALIAKGLGAFKALNLAKEASAFAKIGSAALKNSIQAGLFQGGDEITKGLIGQGDPEAPVATALSHIGGAMLLGGFMGGGLTATGLTASKGLSMLENNKAGTALTDMMTGYGLKGTSNTVPVAKEVLDTLMQNKNIQRGAALADFAEKHAARTVADIGGGIVGSHIHPLLGPVTGFITDKVIRGIGLDKLGNKIAAKGNAYIGPMVLRAASTGRVKNMAQLMDYANALNKGNTGIAKGIDSIFKAGSNEALDFSHPIPMRDKLEKYIENGGADAEIRDLANSPDETPQAFAKGGRVQPTQTQPNSIAEHFPEQAALLSAAKIRISNHLNSVRPLPNVSKLPYDGEYKDPQKKRDYHKVLDLALQPLSILKKIKSGSLVPTDMAHFTQMYPELHSHLSNKLTQRIIKGQLNKETKPPYHVRQAMSLFLGSSLDSTLTQPNMMAAQNVFAMQKAQKSAPAGADTKNGLDKIGQGMRTAEQARTQRLNKG